MARSQKIEQLTESQRHDALQAVRELERKLGKERARWAMRKHLAVMGARQAKEVEIQRLRGELAALRLE